jgi:dipeptidase D
MAAALALLASNSIEHGAIECLFTVDEETGLTGAFAIEEGFISGNIMLNLDSEDEGEIFIGCAGGVDTVATFTYKPKLLPGDSIAYKISISGLKGGHSGDEIQKGLGNSNKIITRFLYQALQKYNVHLSHFDGGNKRNAIPREAFAIFTVNNKFAQSIVESFEKFAQEIRKEIEVTEPNIELRLEKTPLPKYVLNKGVQKRLLNALYACPHGVHAWSPAIEGFVETSTNLASVKFLDKNRIQVVTSQRSSLESGKEDIRNMVASVFHLAGAEVEHSDGYPGWAPNPNSDILKIAEASYERLFGKKPVVRAIHAGLECGLFLEKYPNLDMISFGPTLRGVHSPDEKIEIKTVKMWWDHLVDVLKNV